MQQRDAVLIGWLFRHGHQRLQQNHARQATLVKPAKHVVNRNLYFHAPYLMRCGVASQHRNAGIHLILSKPVKNNRYVKAQRTGET